MAYLRCTAIGTPTAYIHTSIHIYVTISNFVIRLCCTNLSRFGLPVLDSFISSRPFFNSWRIQRSMHVNTKPQLLCFHFYIHFMLFNASLTHTNNNNIALWWMTTKRSTYTLVLIFTYLHIDKETLDGVGKNPPLNHCLLTISSRYNTTHGQKHRRTLQNFPTLHWKKNLKPSFCVHFVDFVSWDGECMKNKDSIKYEWLVLFWFFW